MRSSFLSVPAVMVISATCVSAQVPSSTLERLLTRAAADFDLSWNMGLDARFARSQIQLTEVGRTGSPPVILYRASLRGATDTPPRLFADDGTTIYSLGGADNVELRAAYRAAFRPGISDSTQQILWLVTAADPNGALGIRVRCAPLDTVIVQPDEPEPVYRPSLPCDLTTQKDSTVTRGGIVIQYVPEGDGRDSTALFSNGHRTVRVNTLSLLKAYEYKWERMLFVFRFDDKWELVSWSVRRIPEPD